MNQRERNDLDSYVTGNYGEDQFKADAEFGSPGHRAAIQAALDSANCDPMAFEDHHEPCCSYEGRSGAIRCPCRCHDGPEPVHTDEF